VDLLPNKKSWVDSAKEGAKGVAEIVFGSVIPSLGSHAEELMDRLGNKAIVIEERLLKMLAAGVVMGLAFLFFLLAALFFIVDFYEFTFAQAFFMVGIGLLIIGLFMRLKTR
jgi:hypothetical protein